MAFAMVCGLGAWKLISKGSDSARSEKGLRRSSCLVAEQELNGGVLGTLLGFSLPWKLLFDLPLVLHGSTPVFATF